MKNVLIIKKVHDKLRKKTYEIGDVVELSVKRAKVFINGGYAVEQPTED